MRIAIDIKCLQYNNSGIGRYVRCMLDALQVLDSSFTKDSAVNEYILVSPAPVDYKISNSHFSLKVIPGPSLFGKTIPGFIWQQTTLTNFLKKKKVDIFWGPEQTLPLRNCGCKKILTIHDFVYKRFPETMRRSVLRINRHIGDRSIKIADKIIPVSSFTRQELKYFFPELPESRIQIVPCGIDSTSINAQGSPNRQRLLLFVGSLEPRKNLTNLILALELLQARGIQVPLVITGPAGWKNAKELKQLSNSSIASNVKNMGYVSDTQLAELYASSSAIIFPSLYEGFGLPVLEALAVQTPVLTSKGSVMESIAGKCGMYFDAGNPESIAQVIQDFFSKEKPWTYLENLEQERKDILNFYRWENSARTLMEVFNGMQ